MDLTAVAGVHRAHAPEGSRGGRAPAPEGPRPLRNRGTPLGEVISDPARGLVYANRGVLVDAQGRLRRRFDGRRWIVCRLEFKGHRRAPLMAAGRYTELFFLDEATAWAAGHRPCGECRREDYRSFCALWQGLHPEGVGADAMDRRLHAERVDPVTRGQRRHPMPYSALPDGAFVLADGAPWLVWADELLAWTPDGYAERRPRPRSSGAAAVVLTPPSLVEVLRAGWHPHGAPLVHPTAEARAGAPGLRPPPADPAPGTP